MPIISLPTTTTLLTTAALALVAAAPASADSIAYLKDGNVQLTTLDAARQFQVTSTGGYVAVSQADDGTLLATTSNGFLRRLDRFGAVLSQVSTVGAGASGGGAFSFHGPFDADVSPNGQKAAYGYTYSGYTNTTGGTYVNEGNATAFARTTGETSMSEAGFKQSREYDAPEWIDDTTVLLSNGPGYPSSPIAIATAGSGDSKSWISDPDNPHPLDATISRNKRLVAAVRGDRKGLDVYRDGDAQLLGDVFACFTYSDPDGFRYSSPTFNADGTKLVWASGKGLYIAPVGDMSTTCANGQESKAVLPGASSPDWGPADVPTSRPAGAGAPGGSGAGAGAAGSGSAGSGSGSGAGAGAGTGTTPAPAGQLALTASRASLRRVLARGLPTTVLATSAGRITVTARVREQVVARATVTAKGAGTFRVTLRFSPTAKRFLRRSRASALQLSAAQGTARATAHVTLRR